MTCVLSINPFIKICDKKIILISIIFWKYGKRLKEQELFSLSSRRSLRMFPETEVGADFWRYCEEWRWNLFSLQCPGTMEDLRKDLQPRPMSSLNEEAEEPLVYTDHLGYNVTSMDPKWKSPSPALQNWWEAWGICTILREWLEWGVLKRQIEFPASSAGRSLALVKFYRNFKNVTFLAPYFDGLKFIPATWDINNWMSK